MGDGLKRAVRAAKRTNYSQSDQARLELWPHLVNALQSAFDTEGDAINQSALPKDTLKQIDSLLAKARSIDKMI